MKLFFMLFLLDMQMLIELFAVQISCILAERHPNRVKGMLLVSPGPNFGDDLIKKMESVLPQSVMERIRRGDVVDHSSPVLGIIGSN